MAPKWISTFSMDLPHRNGKLTFCKSSDYQNRKYRFRRFDGVQFQRNYAKIIQKVSPLAVCKCIRINRKKWRAFQTALNFVVTLRMTKTVASDGHHLRRSHHITRFGSDLLWLLLEQVFLLLNQLCHRELLVFGWLLVRWRTVNHLFESSHFGLTSSVVVRAVGLVIWVSRLGWCSRAWWIVCWAWRLCTASCAPESIETQVAHKVEHKIVIVRWGWGSTKCIASSSLSTDGGNAIAAIGWE